MLRIGDFARLGRVTVKALRHYDEQGLLHPAEVDRDTGYRFYLADQLITLSRILQLKDLGFSLTEIRPLLDEPSRLGEALAARRGELAASIEADRERLARLDAARATVEDRLAPAIVVKPVEAVLALTARAMVEPGSDDIQELFEKLERDAAQTRARADANPFLLFHDGAAQTDRLDVEVCVPLNERGGDLKMARQVDGAATAGSLIYRGAYRQTPHLFTRLARWVDANGGAIGGPLREVYLRYGAAQLGYRLPERVLARNASDYVTELIAPIAQ
jgi:DNA-binding transcriptional MerR regulator